MDSSNEIDNIIDQLKSDAVPKQITPSKTKEIENLNDDNVSDYVYKKTAEVIEVGLETVNNLKDLVTSGQDPREIAALAQLISATTKAIDNLNKINLQAKQHKNNLEVAKVEANGTKQLGNGPQTNNILIATRDEIMNKFLDGGKSGKKEKFEILEGDFVKE
jgi:hypothetical protein